MDIFQTVRQLRTQRPAMVQTIVSRDKNLNLYLVCKCASFLNCSMNLRSCEAKSSLAKSLSAPFGELHWIYLGFLCRWSDSYEIPFDSKIRPKSAFWPFLTFHYRPQTLALCKNCIYRFYIFCSYSRTLYSITYNAASSPPLSHLCGKKKIISKVEFLFRGPQILPICLIYSFQKLALSFAWLYCLCPTMSQKLRDVSTEIRLCLRL